jgi:rhodanese-related sulfurtransferase
MIDPSAIERLPRRDPVMRIPEPVRAEPGLFTVDATWGVIQPHELPGGVTAVGELEVVEHVRSGGLLIDTRQPEHVERGTIEGAAAICHEEIVERLHELAPKGTVFLFCNGPQCTATPQAVAALLAAGWDADRLRYYRGGIHMWLTLGLPLTR